MKHAQSIFETSTIQYDKAIKEGDSKIANKFQNSIVKIIVSLHEGNEMNILERFLQHENFSTPTTSCRCPTSRRASTATATA